MYPFCKEDRLVYTRTDHEAIPVRGLYDILLDLDASPPLGDLNSGNIVYVFPSGVLGGVKVEFLFPRWNQVDLAQMLDIITAGVPIQSLTVSPYSSGKPWTITAVYNLPSGSVTFTYYAVITLRQPVANLEAAIEKKLKDLKEDGTPDTTYPLNKAIFTLYQQKLQQTTDLLKQAKAAYIAHRDLCEDFHGIDTVVPVEIGLCADIEVQPQADVSEVLANVYFGVEEYLDPRIRFYTLAEMVAKGVHAEDIFEGPKLDHGFIDTTELKNTQLRTEIRLSDLIPIIMSVDGVLSVKNVSITPYDDKGQPVFAGDTATLAARGWTLSKWCLHLNKNEKPVLNTDRCKVLFFKDKLPFRADAGETQDILLALQGVADRNKLSGHAEDWPVPSGTWYPLDDYYTVQYELPPTYGISPDGLSSTVPDERKAQALQLRAYLLFYDQVLAGFFSQLFHARDLFGLDPTLNQTYFTQYLTEIRDVSLLYRSAVDSHTGLSVTLKDALATPKVTPATPQEVANNNQFYELVESRETFYQRRNGFLDHLLGRFAESFNDYVLLLYHIVGTDKVRIADDKLIADKIAFLKDYPVVSSERGKAFDYLSPGWGTSNVSGLEKRVARLTGMADYSRRNLFCLPVIPVVVTGTAPNQKYFFDITGTGGDLVATQAWDQAADADIMINKVYASIGLPERYGIDTTTTPGQVLVSLRDQYGSTIASGKAPFADPTAAQAFIDSLVTAFKPACDPEGMYLVEHILLRPRFTVTATPPDTPEGLYLPMQVCLAKDCAFCGEEDPYTFRASVILPYWPERFQDTDFRRFFEGTMRMEAPAHVSLKICWVNYTSMAAFQDLYQQWLGALRDYAGELVHVDTAKQDALRVANNKLVAFLGSVHSEYPEARLHDCDTGITNPVLLGSTVLGTF